MKKLHLNIALFLLIFLSMPAIAQKSSPDETNKAIVSALSSGNSEALARYFNKMVDLGIAGNEDTYSLTQATRIVQEFFTRNKVKSVKISRQGTSNDGSQFSIGEMNAGNQNFRVYYLLKKVDGQYLIQQLQIQQENP